MGKRRAHQRYVSSLAVSSKSVKIRVTPSEAIICKAVEAVIRKAVAIIVKDMIRRRLLLTHNGTNAVYSDAEITTLQANVRASIGPQRAFVQSITFATHTIGVTCQFHFVAFRATLQKDIEVGEVPPAVIYEKIRCLVKHAAEIDEGLMRKF